MDDGWMVRLSLFVASRFEKFVDFDDGGRVWRMDGRMEGRMDGRKANFAD
jgi:hypothetical protein